MNILTKRNGIALVAVMVVLLFLTLLLPVMFSMSDSALVSAMKGTDELRSSYLARTMIEMSVSAFEDCYDAAMEDKELGVPVTNADSDYYKMNKFMTETKIIEVSTLYMYRNNDVSYPKDIEKPVRSDFDTDKEYKEEYDEYIKSTYGNYMENGIVYSTNLPSIVSSEANLKTGVTYSVDVNNKDGSVTTYNNCQYIGKSDCTIKYDDEIEYYKTEKDGKDAYKTTKLGANGKTLYDNYIKNATNPTTLSDTAPQYFKIEKRNVVFSSEALVNGKLTTRKCVLVLPTKPAENQWIVPANLESNQIFPDTSKASSVKTLKVNDSFFIDDSALKGQPVYIFSCIGNMVISSKDIQYGGMEYNEYVADHNTRTEAHIKEVDDHNKQVQANIDAGVDNPGTFRQYEMSYIDNHFADFSLGVHPITTTLNPENDPTFSCLKTNNMRSWASSSQRDNFIAFTATNGIQVDMPLNLIMNPCRTGRIGDGFDKNQSLYKVMYFQAPTIVFNNTVNSFISLYHKGVLANIFDYNAYRMTSVILAAPQSTPYSYYNNTRGKTVKAGKVIFSEDAYIWLVPYSENGSNYRTQTVYYKGKDIILYKFANAGDVFLFNSDVLTSIKSGQAEPETVNAGFSMTGYFMDVIYNREETKTNQTPWYDFWSRLQEWIYEGVQGSGYREPTYVEEDLKWQGNIYGASSSSAPLIDDFYVIWES